MDREEIEKILESVSKLKVLVVGDAMLDVFIKGMPSHISSEAPVPVIHFLEEKYYPGGAANLANNVKNLVDNVDFLCCLGEDEYGETLKKRLEEQGIKLIPFFCREAKTIKKIRIVAPVQQICRVDEESDSLKYQIPFQEFTKLFIPEKYDLIIISDYAKGLINQKIYNHIRKTAKGKIIAVDPKPKNKIFYKGADLIKPNFSEALAITKADIGNDLIEAFNNEQLAPATIALIEFTIPCIKLLQQIKNVVMTAGMNGMFISKGKEGVIHIPAIKRFVYNSCGAGDTAMAVLSTVFAAGFGLEKAAQLANYAASIAVASPITFSIQKEFLFHFAKS